MLFHCLPVDKASCCSLAFEAPHKAFARARRVPVFSAQAAIRGLDMIGIAALSWGFVRFTPLAGPATPWGLLAAFGLLLATSRVFDTRTSIPGANLPCAIAACVLLFSTAGAAQGSGGAQIPPLLFSGCSALWIVTLRISWRAMLGALLQRGWCFGQVMVVAPSLAIAQPIASLVEQRSGGKLRATARAAGPVAERAASLAAIATAGETGGFDHMIVIDAGRGSAALQIATKNLLGRGTQVTLLPACSSASQVLDACGLPAHAQPPRGLNDGFATAKRATDLVLGLTISILAMPLLLGIALAIKLDSPGAVLFCQARVGLNGRVFPLWKFRTMFERASVASETLQTSRNDSRVTPLGRFLRRTSLDELPQLFNVLAGDMSIVGPRPHAVGMTIEGQTLSDLLPFYDERHRMKPGITGWAQVNGCRGELATCKALRRRVALDRHYIENWSLRLDGMIMGRTAALLFLDRHAF